MRPFFWAFLTTVQAIDFLRVFFNNVPPYSIQVLAMFTANQNRGKIDKRTKDVWNAIYLQNVVETFQPEISRKAELLRMLGLEQGSTLQTILKLRDVICHKAPAQINRLQDIVAVIMKLKRDGFLTTPTSYGIPDTENEPTCSLIWLHVVVMIEWISFLYKTEKIGDIISNRWLKKLLSDHMDLLDYVDDNPNASRGFRENINNLVDVIDSIEERASAIQLNSNVDQDLIITNQDYIDAKLVIAAFQV